MPPPATMFACVIFRVIDISVTMTFHGAGIMAHKARAAKKKQGRRTWAAYFIISHLTTEETGEVFYFFRNARECNIALCEQTQVSLNHT